MLLFLFLSCIIALSWEWSTHGIASWSAIISPQNSNHKRSDSTICKIGPTSLVFCDCFFFKVRRYMKRIKGRLYGQLLLKRGVCLACGEECLICNDGTSSCCHSKAIIYKSGTLSKETISARDRKINYIPKEYKEKTLKEQDNKCYWCGRPFGNIIVNKKTGSYVYLHVCWDHYIPYSFIGDSRPINFVASCQICNSFKSGVNPEMLEGEEEEMKKRISEKWKNSKWVDADVFLGNCNAQGK